MKTSKHYRPSQIQPEVEYESNLSQKKFAGLGENIKNFTSQHKIPVMDKIAKQSNDGGFGSMNSASTGMIRNEASPESRAKTHVSAMSIHQHHKRRLYSAIQTSAASAQRKSQLSTFDKRHIEQSSANRRPQHTDEFKSIEFS